MVSLRFFAIWVLVIITLISFAECAPNRNVFKRKIMAGDQNGNNASGGSSNGNSNGNSNSFGCPNCVQSCSC